MVAELWRIVVAHFITLHVVKLCFLDTHDFEELRVDDDIDVLFGNLNLVDIVNRAVAARIRRRRANAPPGSNPFKFHGRRDVTTATKQHTQI